MREGELNAPFSRKPSLQYPQQSVDETRRCQGQTLADLFIELTPASLAVPLPEGPSPQPEGAIAVGLP